MNGCPILPPSSPRTCSGGHRAASAVVVVYADQWTPEQVRGDGASGRSGSKPRRAGGGFTLIEMMVALAVFSLAALALIRLEGATIRGASILDSTLTAQMVARNVAIEAMTDARPPTIGIARGVEHNGGRTWNWTRETRPTGDSRIVRIDVEVMDSVGSRKGHLTVVRAGTVGGAAS